MNISVVIPLYNKIDSVLGTLNSISNQTYLPKEIIIVNDGSTDGSEKLIKELNNPLIRLFNQTNEGVSAARNFGIEKAKGEWIAFLDADDEWKPTYLENINFLYKNYPNCEVLATAYELEDQKGNSKQITLNKIPFPGNHGVLNNYFEVASCSHPPICSSSVTIKKGVIKETGGFPLGIKSGEDLLTWASLAINFKIAYSLSVQSIFIQDPAHTDNKLPNRIPELPDKVGSKLIELLNYKHTHSKGLKQYISHWFIMRSAIFLRLDESKKARKEILKSLKFNPLVKKAYIFLIIAVMPIKSSVLFGLIRNFRSNQN
ncbi:MAG: glycosyltransferase family 2 protein [Bacteroidota bacterium]